MALVSLTVLVTVPRRLRQFWSFYRRYTTTAIHTAATVALAIFGILVFLDPWFAAIAIGSYVVPPVVLYVLEFEPPSPEGTSSADHNRNGETRATRDRAVEPVASTPETGRSRGGGSDTDTDTDTDSDDGDTDSDSDSDDGDTDSDSDDGDTDSDSDSDS